MVGHHESLRREVLRLAMPTAAEQLIILGASLVNVALAGHLGAASLAALGLSIQIVALTLILLVPLGVGGGVLVAQAIGASQERSAHRLLGHALIMSVVTGIGLMFTGLALAGPLLQLMGAEPEALRLGTPLLRLMAVAMPFQSYLYVVTSCLRGAGDTRTPMAVTAVATIVQLLTSVALVNGLAGLPELGTLGIGVGILAGQIVGALLLLAGLASTRLNLSLARVPWKPRGPVVRSILRVGSPAGGEQLSLRLGMAAGARIVASLGTTVYAANVIAFNCMSVALVVGAGFSVAATIMVGQRVGAGQPSRARASASVSLQLASIIMGLMGLVFLIWTRPILGLFTSDMQVINLAVTPLRIAALILPIEAINQVLGGAMRGAGDTRWPMITTTWGNWLVRIPLALVLTGWLGLVGAWLATAADIVLRAIANFLYYRTDRWLRYVQPKRGGDTA